MSDPNLPPRRYVCTGCGKTRRHGVAFKEFEAGPPVGEPDWKRTCSDCKGALLDLCDPQAQVHYGEMQGEDRWRQTAVSAGIGIGVGLLVAFPLFLYLLQGVGMTGRRLVSIPVVAFIGLSGAIQQVVARKLEPKVHALSLDNEELVALRKLRRGERRR